MAWQTTQGLTASLPPATGVYFRAISSYSQPSAIFLTTERSSVRLTCAAESFEHDGQLFSSLKLNLEGANYSRSSIEILAVGSGYFLTQIFRESELLQNDGTIGLWRANRPWSDVAISSALANGGENIGGFCWIRQRYGCSQLTKSLSAKLSGRVISSCCSPSLVFRRRRIVGRDRLSL